MRAVDPVDLELSPEKYPSNDYSSDAARVLDGITQGQEAAPTATHYNPVCQTEVSTQIFQVTDNIPRCILSRLGVWSAAAGTALIDQHDAIVLRIKEPAIVRHDPDPWSAMKKKGRTPRRVADLFVNNRMKIGDLQTADVEWFDCRVQRTCVSRIRHRIRLSSAINENLDGCKRHFHHRKYHLAIIRLSARDIEM
jgi:hypothetical protein